MLCSAVLLAVLGFGGFANANVEKIVFTAPRHIESAQPLSSLQLDVLSSRHRLSLRKQLPVAFPTTAAPNGLHSWYLLDGLEPGRRYEVRICWAATQPTAFWLHRYTLGQVFDNTSLLASITGFSHAQKSKGEAAEGLIKDALTTPEGLADDSTRSQLLLQVLAAADYYTTNKTLMRFPAPVHVDIILDPYILFILPQSLLPTAVYILLIAVGSWFLSDYIWIWLRDLSQETDSTEGDHENCKAMDVPSAARPTLRHHYPLAVLPQDILLLIIDRLTPVEFIKFAFATYPMLLQHDLVPGLTPRRVALFVNQVRHARLRPTPPTPGGGTNHTSPASTPQITHPPPPAIQRYIPLPAELLMQIMRLLKPIDRMRFVLADYGDLKDVGIAPKITLTTLGTLKVAAGWRIG